jgi:transcriptional regulator with XRE-family HTH domain
MLDQQLHEARVAHNLSISRLAQLSGVPKERIRQIEMGANFTMETLQKLLPHLPKLHALQLGPAELRVRGVDVAGLRDEMAEWLESGRRLLTMFERLTVVADVAAAAPNAVRSANEVTPELEARLRRLESEVATARKSDQRES